MELDHWTNLEGWGKSSWEGLEEDGQRRCALIKILSKFNCTDIRSESTGWLKNFPKVRILREWGRQSTGWMKA